MGLTRRRERKYTIGLALEKSIGGEGTQWNESVVLWYGVTKPLMLWGAEVGEMNESGMECKES